MPEPPETQFPDVWSKLCNARRTNRLGHAYCLVGDDPQLLEAFGRRWARVCACRGDTENGDACGECRPCQQLENGVYPEFLELRPQSKSRQILVDQIRDFEHSLRLTTAAGRIKIGLLVEADRLVTQAQNAFLKTLEEPPRNVILILLTTQLRGLLPTIRSRCQIVSVRTNRKVYNQPAVQSLFPLLARMHRGAGSGVAIAVAHELRQRFGEFGNLAEENVADGAAENVTEEIEQDERLQKRLDKVHDARVRAEYIRLRQEAVEAIQVWFQQQSLIAHGASEESLPNPEMLTAAKTAVNQLPRVSRADAEADVQATAELGRDFAMNVDERLALETFCLTVCQHSSN